MDTASSSLEAAILACGEEQDCGVLVLDLDDQTQEQGSILLSAKSWPDPWKSVAPRQTPGKSPGKNVWWVSTPQIQAPGWVQTFPVWLARARGAQAMLVLGRPTKVHPALSGASRGFWHLEDVLDLDQDSPLIGLGPSPRGPLFPDRTQVLDGPLTARIQNLLGSLGAVAASTSSAVNKSAGPYWDLVVPHLAAPLSAAAHAGLPTVALVVGDAAPTLPFDAIMEALLMAPDPSTTSP